MKHRVKAQVDLNRIAENYNYIKSLVGTSKVMAVVKADAYGHGANEVSKRLSLLGCNDFAVACLSEALELRESGINGNILILGPTDALLIDEIADNGFVQTAVLCAYFQYDVVRYIGFFEKVI
jgi:alanine racemase